MADDYKVGYGRPPLHTRFKPGASGNPTGLRKRPLTPVEEEAKLLFEEKHTIHENGRKKRANAVTAALRVLRAKALAGDLRAIDRVLARADKLAAKLRINVPKDPGAEKADMLREALLKIFTVGTNGPEEA
jgi:hypothetical protein